MMQNIAAPSRFSQARANATAPKVTTKEQHNCVDGFVRRSKQPESAGKIPKELNEQSVKVRATGAFALGQPTGGGGMACTGTITQPSLASPLNATICDCSLQGRVCLLQT